MSLGFSRPSFSDYTFQNPTYKPDYEAAAITKSADNAGGHEGENAQSHQSRTYSALNAKREEENAYWSPGTADDSDYLTPAQVQDGLRHSGETYVPPAKQTENGKASKELGDEESYYMSAGTLAAQRSPAYVFSTRRKYDISDASKRKERSCTERSTWGIAFAALCLAVAACSLAILLMVGVIGPQTGERERLHVTEG